MVTMTYSDNRQQILFRFIDTSISQLGYFYVINGTVKNASQNINESVHRNVFGEDNILQATL